MFLIKQMSSLIFCIKHELAFKVFISLLRISFSKGPRSNSVSFFPSAEMQVEVDNKLLRWANPELFFLFITIFAKYKS